MWVEGELFSLPEGSICADCLVIALFVFVFTCFCEQEALGGFPPCGLHVCGCGAAGSWRQQGRGEGRSPGR